MNKDRQDDPIRKLLERIRLSPASGVSVAASSLRLGRDLPLISSEWTFIPSPGVAADVPIV
jgi:hypothetical protein